MKPALLILAAGIGSRYGGVKQLDAIGPGGETIIDYSIYDAISTGFGKIVFVINEKIEKEFTEHIIRKWEPSVATGYVLQEIRMVPAGATWPKERTKPWGTAHAVLMAEGLIDTPFAVINADDFYGREAYRALVSYYAGWTPERRNDYSMVAYEIGKTLSEHGSVSRGICQTGTGGLLVDVVERTWIERRGKEIVYRDEAGRFIPLPEKAVVSMNFWGFTPSVFGYLKSGFLEFIKEKGDDPSSEYYIPAAVNRLIRSDIATVKVLPCSSRWYGVTYREDREMVVNGVRRLIEKGVYPEKLSL